MRPFRVPRSWFLMIVLLVAATAAEASFVRNAIDEADRSGLSRTNLWDITFGLVSSPPFQSFIALPLWLFVSLSVIGSIGEPAVLVRAGTRTRSVFLATGRLASLGLKAACTVFATALVAGLGQPLSIGWSPYALDRHRASLGVLATMQPLVACAAAMATLLASLLTIGFALGALRCLAANAVWCTLAAATVCAWGFLSAGPVQLPRPLSLQSYMNLSDIDAPGPGFAYVAAATVAVAAIGFTALAARDRKKPLPR